MKCLSLAVAILGFATVAQAVPATGTTEAGPAAAVARDSSMKRYHQLRRLDRRELGRPDFQQGANCVTPKLVCWVPQPGTFGDACSCTTPSRGRVAGTIEG